jgi:hypothetical protein
MRYILNAPDSNGGHKHVQAFSQFPTLNEIWQLYSQSNFHNRLKDLVQRWLL